MLCEQLRAYVVGSCVHCCVSSCVGARSVEPHVTGSACNGACPPQVGATVRQGGRPEVPAREALPGPDSASWAGLDTYVALMR